MELEDFRLQFIDELRFKAEHEGTEPEIQFVEKILADLEEIGEVNDPVQVSVEMRGSRGRILAFDAYAYDEADGALIMIASDFTNQRNLSTTLINTRIDELHMRMQNFIEESVNGNISKFCDDSSPALEIAKEFRKKIGDNMISTEILRFKFIIISNSILSKQVKNLTKPEFLDRPVELNVWTLERFYQAFVSNSSEIIEIETADFGCSGIQCLKADLGGNSNYEAYLGIVPGKFLANIYLKYGSKLLQGNIRAFLSVRGKVNKGIRNTIINNPEKFFTFNNGIAIVARSVGFSSDGTQIVSFKDLQIITGGQTTASLANAIIKKEIKHDMETLYVPMKLTVLNVEDDMSEEQVERYNTLTKEISQCANSQNAVSEADFFSNHPFHVLMEKLSRKVMAPAVNGNPYQTIWFYERSRGKWDQEQMQLKEAGKKKFCEMHPKNQVIKKEKLAKCYNAILMNPHQVCQSSAINFNHFAPFVEKIYSEQRDSINENFFKKCVSSVILFDSLDSLIAKASWYPKGGNKAQIVPYTISKLMTLIPKDKDLDWTSIWQKQALYPELVDELLKLAYVTHNFLMKQADGGIVRTKARTQALWKDFQDVDYVLSDEFVETLPSLVESKDIEAAAKRVTRFNLGVDMAVKIFSMGSDYWMRVYNDFTKENLLSFGDRDFINNIVRCINRGSLPSSAQCNRLKRIIDVAENAGYVFPES